MKDSIIRIYDFFSLHRAWLWIGFAVVLLAVGGLASTLSYNEDIMDFLPVTEEEKEAFQTVQANPSASRIIFVLEGGDEQLRAEAIDELDELLAASGYQLSTDPTDQIAQLYTRLPDLISDSTYGCLDSLFTPEAVHAALLRDKSLLSTPGTSFLVPAVRSDPLGLADRRRLSGFRSSLSGGKSYAFLDTPYGSTETGRNAALVDSLNVVIQTILTDHRSPTFSIRLTGAPVIAVGNARRIKSDTMLCISLSFVLIVLLLAYAFPRRRELLLILLSVSFGWLVGMAVLRLVTPTVSAIVLGIGSVLIGIAVNYPLHLLVHRRYTASVRQTLDEVLSPLVVGNITTVGAFLALVPLQATALRHLGVFAAAMLVGTIWFCIFVLPHLMSAEPTPVREIKLPSFARTPFRLSARRFSWIILGITVLAGLYLVVSASSSRLRPLFDSNLTHINYMTPEQRADMASLDSLTHTPSSGNSASLWQEYWSSHDPQQLVDLVRAESDSVGFTADAFQPFYDLLLSADSRQNSSPGLDFSAVAGRLSADFDYIGACCSLIVFIFLWISFRRFSLALVAFMPMVLSWIWIFAIMHLTGLQFNIVNIILATFIFGQGDDYTIFIVEGLLFERRTGKPILPQYRQSIILSALIMLVGIGILIFAVHPAMHSLGVVTLIGMSVVLLMAFTVPPLFFTEKSRKSTKKRP